MRFTKNISGKTLIELMVSISILAFVMLCAWGILSLGNRISATDGTLLEMAQQTRNGLQRMVKEVRQSSAHTIVTNSATSDTLTFTIPTASNVKYYIQNNYLVREYPTGTIAKIASNISYLKFNVSNKVMTIELRAQKSLYASTIAFPLVGKVRLRNE